MYEVLIQSLEVNNKNSTVLYPVGCPGRESQDIVKDKNGEPCCNDHNRVCPFLKSAIFDRSKFKKTVQCNYESQILEQAPEQPAQQIEQV